MKYEIAKTQFGTFLVNDQDLILKHIKKDLFWDAHLKPVFDCLLLEDSVMIDVGAHCGFYSIYCSKICDKVVAFEPQKYAFYLLCANIILNGAGNVEPNNCAVYSRLAHMSMLQTTIGQEINYEDCTNTGAFSFVENQNGQTETITIDSLNQLKIDLIKIDAQGSDFDILYGSKTTLLTHRPCVIYEYSYVPHVHETLLLKYRDLLWSLDYDIFVLNFEKRDFLAMPREKYEVTKSKLLNIHPQYYNENLH